MKFREEPTLVVPKKEQIPASVLASVWDKMLDIINSDQIQDHLAPVVIFLMGAVVGRVINILCRRPQILDPLHPN